MSWDTTLIIYWDCTQQKFVPVRPEEDSGRDEKDAADPDKA